MVACATKIHLLSIFSMSRVIMSTSCVSLQVLEPLLKNDFDKLKFCHMVYLNNLGIIIKLSLVTFVSCFFVGMQNWRSFCFLSFLLVHSKPANLQSFHTLNWTKYNNHNKK